MMAISHKGQQPTTSSHAERRDEVQVGPMKSRSAPPVGARFTAGARDALEQFSLLCLNL